MVTMTGALTACSAHQPSDGACDGQSGWPTLLRSWNLGPVVRSSRFPRRNCEDWLSCRRTSRCSGRSRRREIGATSTNRSCGARAAERQGVRQTGGGGGELGRLLAAIAGAPGGHGSARIREAGAEGKDRGGGDCNSRNHRLRPTGGGDSISDRALSNRPLHLTVRFAARR